LKKEALKLADDLDNLHEQDKIDGVAHLSMPMAAEMIRKLVAELDKYRGKNFDDIIIDEYSNKQEPVAWGMYSLKTKQFTGITNSPKYGEEERMCIPLYTAPRELSDDEIDRVVDETYGVPRNPGIYASHRRLAKAILKKASEK
jgi:hypothetical protein